jgi:hypothetical protein
MLSLPVVSQRASQFISLHSVSDGMRLTAGGEPVSILYDSADERGIDLAVKQLKADLQAVTGVAVQIIKPGDEISGNLIIVGSVSSSLVSKLAAAGKVNPGGLKGKREKFEIQVVKDPLKGIDKALVIAGSDRRGTIYGIYELAEQCGVSPWYFWADVPVRRTSVLYVKPGIYTAGEPAVRYRGIFLNDEAPALSGWARARFGGFNHRFYEKVFELILRLKGNFLWPAMWGNAFFDDDPLNGELADRMGIVISTSHHEPMGRAHAEWSRYGRGKWDYSSNSGVLDEFWAAGMERMKNFETVVTLAMRGDGDEPMSEENNIALLEKIVKNQRTIIRKVTGKKITETPQVWALYKEVQDYYDKGMRVPDDVTLLFADDNWGNVRKLPEPGARKREGGYGMYYHFDYVGGPRNYKWLNVTQVQRMWEQMNLTRSHGVDRIWVVNVGDLKPMEYPISFFMDMAWNPDQFNSRNLVQHTERWCEAQFGAEYARESARIIDTYTKYARRITPELLNDTSYSLQHYNEFERVVHDFRALALDAFRLHQQLPDSLKDSFDQLVLFPANAFSNIYEMYYAVARNKEAARNNNPDAAGWADEVRRCFERDSLLTIHYNRRIAKGKWAHMMDQIRIGYTYWQQPEKAVMPLIATTPVYRGHYFVEMDGVVSIEAGHFNRKQENTLIRWEEIPNLGKTRSGITTFPADAYPFPGTEPALEYDIVFEKTGEVEVIVLLSPTLNFNNNKGLRYSIAIGDAAEQQVNMNGLYNIKQMEHWQANSINETTTRHTITKAGKTTLRLRVHEPGIVIQKIIINTGGLKKSYLGTPETIRYQ